MRNYFYLIIRHFHGADLANLFADECMDYLYFVEKCYVIGGTLTLDVSRNLLNADVDLQIDLLDHYSSYLLVENVPANLNHSRKPFLIREVTPFSFVPLLLF